jgi:SAM-dependent methyltransferase
VSSVVPRSASRPFVRPYRRSDAGFGATRSVGAVIYQHPLAYVLAVEGAALLRAFAGEHDRDFTLARIAEVRAFVEAADAWGAGVTLPSVTTPDGYRTWAETYDQPGNQLVDLEQPVVHEILQRLPAGIALDVACGTGRHTGYLAELGHRVIGVDSAPAMLDLAATNVPGASLARADLHQLPIPDHAVDVIVCALALTHVPDLVAALTELVRVLRPGEPGLTPPAVWATQNAGDPWSEEGGSELVVVVGPPPAPAVVALAATGPVPQLDGYRVTGGHAAPDGCFEAVDGIVHGGEQL